MADPSSDPNATSPGAGPRPLSLARRLEILHDRFGLLTVIAHASLKLIEQGDPEFFPPMDEPTAWGILSFADELREARDAVMNG